jgi:ubiquinone/menaquinone biosynthesis C-methylase UbiE
MENGTSWKQFKGKETPSTVELNKLFFEKVPAGSNILDFGCAWGRIAFKLQKKGFNVTGFDINENAIKTAIKKSKKTNNQYSGNVFFTVANALKLPYSDKIFDVCIIQAFLTTISSESRLKVLSEAWRVLKENGILYLADFGQNWKNPKYRQRYLRDYSITGEIGTFIVTDDGEVDGKELFLAHHYTKNELYDLLKDGFNVETFHETVFTTFHGNRTKGYVIIGVKRELPYTIK